MTGTRARARPVLVTLLVLVSVLFPAAAVLAQTNESGNETGEDASPGGDLPAGDDAAEEEGNATANGTDDQAAPAREGAPAEPGEEEAVGSQGTAWVLTLSVIVVSLLVGFAVAAVAGDRRR